MTDNINIELTLAELEEKAPQVRDWHRVFCEVDRVTTELGIPGESVWDRLGKLLARAKEAAALTPPVPMVQAHSSRALPGTNTEDLVLQVFLGQPEREFTATEVTEAAGLHETTVRHYLDVLTRTGDLTSRRAPPHMHRGRGRRPMLYKKGRKK